jgi:micrococcal nuclease
MRKIRRLPVRWVAVGVLVCASTVMLVRSMSGANDDGPAKPTRVTVKGVLSGDLVKVKHHGRVVYAGIRAPFGGEPLYEEAVRRNAELVEGKEIRLRYGEQPRDRDGRLQAYAFLGDAFLNDIMVREGLAYVRLTTTTRRFADRLLDAQRQAREDRRGIWRHVSDSSDDSYPADPKYGNFHRVSCAEVPKIKPDRLVTFESKDAAFDAGYAPCDTCLP